MKRLLIVLAIFCLWMVEDVKVAPFYDPDFGARTWVYTRLGNSWGAGGWYGVGDFRAQ